MVWISAWGVTRTPLLNHHGLRLLHFQHGYDFPVTTLTWVCLESPSDPNQKWLVIPQNWGVMTPFFLVMESLGPCLIWGKALEHGWEVLWGYDTDSLDMFAKNLPAATNLKDRCRKAPQTDMEPRNGIQTKQVPLQMVCQHRGPEKNKINRRSFLCCERPPSVRHLRTWYVGCHAKPAVSWVKGQAV